MASDLPFDPPNEPIAQVVAQHLDFASRLDALERNQRGTVERLTTVARLMSSLTHDVSRVMDVATSTGLINQRLERKVDELSVNVKELLVRLPRV